MERPRQPGKWDYLFRISVCPGNFLACLLLGALSNKGGREQRNREEIGGGSNFFTQLRRSFPRASRRILRPAASPLVRPARQNRHNTQTRNFPVGRAVYHLHLTRNFQEFVLNGKQPVSGAPNDGFLLNVLKSHFRLFRVLKDLF